MIRRDDRDRGRGQVTSLDWQQTERVCAFAKSENTIAGLRDSAMIRMMSECLLCVSEVVAVNVSDFEKQALIVRTSKTDQEGTATALYVRIIQKRAAAASVEGFIAGHCLRVGPTIALAQAIASVVEMRTTDRWKNSQMPAYYAKSELSERGAIAKYKEKQQTKRA